MRIAREALTVIADPPRGEVEVILSGLRVTLDTAEATGLRRQLEAALARVENDGPVIVARGPVASADEAM